MLAVKCINPVAAFDPVRGKVISSHPVEQWLSHQPGTNSDTNEQGCRSRQNYRKFPARCRHDVMVPTLAIRPSAAILI